MKLLKNLLLFLLIYIPLEEFILKWIPVPIPIFEKLLLFSDALIFFSLFIFIAKNNFVIKYKRDNLFLFFFIIFSLVSLFIYQSWIVYILKVWVLIRYILVFYMIRSLFNYDDYNKFIKYFFYMFYFQFLVGLIQFIDISFITDFFNPRGDLSKSSNWFVKGESGLAGTFTFTVNYGYFMFAFSAFVTLTNRSLQNKYFLMFLAMILSLLSESIISFGLTFLLFSRFIQLNNPRFFYSFFIISLFIILFFAKTFLIEYVPQIASVFNIFTLNYIEDSLNFTRLGILKLFPLFFSNDIITILFGFSLNIDSLSNFIFSNFDGMIPHILSNNVAIGIEDVYWIAHLYYFGLVGTILFICIFIYLYIYLNKYKLFFNDPIKFKIQRLYIILTLLSAFVNQTFSFKSFIVYFFFTISFAIFKLNTRTMSVKDNI